MEKYRDLLKRLIHDVEVAIMVGPISQLDIRLNSVLERFESQIEAFIELEVRKRMAGRSGGFKSDPSCS